MNSAIISIIDTTRLLDLISKIMLYVILDPSNRHPCLGPRRDQSRVRASQLRPEGKPEHGSAETGSPVKIASPYKTHLKPFQPMHL